MSRSSHLRRCARLAPGLLVVFAIGVEAQTLPGGMTMVEPSPPLPGDAALTCDQIGREMYTIMQKRGLSKNAKENFKAGCEAKKAMTPTAAQYAAMTSTSPAAIATQQKMAADMSRTQAPVMANAMQTMQVMNDPRLMRLGILAQEKHCAVQEPAVDEDSPQEDPCGEALPEAHRNAAQLPSSIPDAADPFRASVATPSPASGAASDPFAPRAATPTPSVTTKPAPKKP